MGFKIPEIVLTGPSDAILIIICGCLPTILAREENIEYLGSIPLDPRVNEYTGRNQTFLQKHPESPVAKAVTEICSRIIRILEGGKEEH